MLTYYGITTYQNQQEQNNFYNTIQNTSQIENQSDAQINTYRNQSTITTNQAKEITTLTINTTTQEINILEKLYNNTNNETLKNYTQIQIDRLTAEKKTNEYTLQMCDEYEQAKQGQRSITKTLDDVINLRHESETYSNITKEKKIEAEEFLNHHQDIKQKFKELNIDEDFMTNQMETNNISYVK